MGRDGKLGGGSGGRGTYMYLWLIHADVRHPQAVLCMLIIECCFIVIVTEHIFYTQRMCALACMYIYICLWLVDIWKG